MAIVLLFAIVVVGAVVTLGFILLVSASLGYVLWKKRGRTYGAALLLLGIPSAVVGAVLGGVGVGAWAIRANGSLLFWGPLAGTCAGALVGGLLGLGAALSWSRRGAGVAPAREGSEEGACGPTKG